MLKSIQLLRAIAAWMVVFYHAMQIYFGLNGENWFSIFFSRYGSMGVDIFFVISGFVIYNSTDGKNITPARFIANRIIRIVPAYWVFTLLTALLVYNYKELIPFTQMEAKFLFDSLFFVPSFNPSGIGLSPLLTVGWSLNYEMAFYLIFCFALFASKRYRLLCVAVGIVILQVALPKFGGVLEFFSGQFAFEFLYGILVGLLYKKGLLKKINLPMAIMILCVAFFTVATKENLPPVNWLHTGGYLYTVGIPSALIVAAVLSQESHLPNFNWLAQLGDWSYATYLSHVIVLSAAYKITQIWQVPPFMTILLSCVVILMISYLSFVFVERKSSLYFKGILATVAGK